MFNKILIANRGEIACRVMRTAKKLGIQTVAVYSSADTEALHVKMADEAVYIGGAAPADSYLQQQRILDAAILTNAEAIHPGYGFLSENAEFAKLCNAANLTFIGPPSSAIDAMGSKSAAKAIMQDAGVPILPGYHGQNQSTEHLRSAAQEVGYPVLLKAAAGGGGKGMRQVLNDDEFSEGLEAAKREAMSSFGDDIMLVEKLLVDPRHVEVQVFCDSQGHGVYLFERDCSVQRRHQKIIEEAPAPGVSQALRQQMGEAAVQAALAINYQGAGTVEFLLAENNEFFFMEMNTRLQVEHPVTEMITQQDLVEWQLKVAAGGILPLKQSELAITGHAFEARIYAENPNNDFLPAAGRLDFLHTPDEDDHIRLDSGVIQGDSIGVHYDPMIAKLVTWGENRESALARLHHALTEYRIQGVLTNVAFLTQLSCHPAFVNAEVHTGFIEQHRQSLFATQELQTVELANAYAIPAICQLILNQPSQPSNTPWQTQDNWRANLPRIHRRTIRIGDDELAITANEVGQQWMKGLTATAEPVRNFEITVADRTHQVAAQKQGHRFMLNSNGHQRYFLTHVNRNLVTMFATDGSNQRLEFEDITSTDIEALENTDTNGFVAPMNGTITSITATQGDHISKGTTLIIMEAMKMEHAMQASTDGVVGEIYYNVGDLVEGGAVLLEFEPLEE